jgi:prepilin-type N-terminal cleavage/methylation domain-containing protein
MRRGFTLTELLVVMGIMVLMAAFLVPVVGPMFANRALDGSVNVLTGQIYKARSLAAATGATYYLTFNTVRRTQHMTVMYWGELAPNNNELDFYAESGDDRNQLSGYGNLDNIKTSNSDKGILYINIEAATPPAYQVKIYSDSGRTSLVAHTDPYERPGEVSIIPDLAPSDNLTGWLYVDAVVGTDTDIVIDQEIVDEPVLLAENVTFVTDPDGTDNDWLKQANAGALAYIAFHPDGRAEAHGIQSPEAAEGVYEITLQSGRGEAAETRTVRLVALTGQITEEE